MAARSETVSWWILIPSGIIAAVTIKVLLSHKFPWWEQSILGLVVWVSCLLPLGSYLIWAEKPLVAAQKRITELETEIWERDHSAK